MAEFQEFQACQVGDVGVALIVAVVDQLGDPVDLTAATALKIRVEKPDGTGVVYDATLYTDGTDGKIVYATEDGDLDEAGQWSIQGRYTLAGAEKSTAVSPFVVNPNTTDPVEPEP